MDTIKISDTGTNLLISGSDRGAVQAALDGMIARGSSLVSPLSQVGKKWFASCSKPLASDKSDSEDQSDIDAVIRESVWGAVRVEEAGANIIVTGKEKSAVEKALQLLAADVAGAITPVAPLGNGWIGSCTNPKAEAACTVEKLGHQAILTGPSEAAIRAKFRELQVGGAKAVSEIQETGGKFMLVCDYRA